MPDIHREIERKFTVSRRLLPFLTNGKKIRQGYLSFENPTRRVRLVEWIDGTKSASIDEKERGADSGDGPLDAEERNEKIDFEEAERLLGSCQGYIICKTRYNISFESKLWEIDVYSAENDGLIVAELELESRNELFVLPPWLAAEVTRDQKYLNSNLARRPFSVWERKERIPALL